MADHERRVPADAGSPATWDDGQLERALRDLGHQIEQPATPDLARAVRRRLATELPRPTRADRHGRHGDWFGGVGARRAVAVATLALVVLGAAVLALVPDVRDTVGGWFGVRGIRIVFIDETPTPVLAPTPALPATPEPTPTPQPLGTSLLLGERVSLEEAQARVSFPLRLPDPALLGPPDEVYVRDLPDGPMVSLLYYARPDLPATAETGVGLLLVQFAAPPDSFWISKAVSPANEVQIVDLNGDNALWLIGAHNLMIAPDPIPLDPSATTRLAGNVLVWDDDGITFRLESDLSGPRAVMLAERLTPIATPAPGTPSP